MACLTRSLARSTGVEVLLRPLSPRDAERLAEARREDGTGDDGDGDHGGDWRRSFPLRFLLQEERLSRTVPGCRRNVSGASPGGCAYVFDLAGGPLRGAALRLNRSCCRCSPPLLPVAGEESLRHRAR